MNFNTIAEKDVLEKRAKKIMHSFLKSCAKKGAIKTKVLQFYSKGKIDVGDEYSGEYKDRVYKDHRHE